MFPWFLCLLSTSSVDVPAKSFPEFHSRSSIWWNPTESIRGLNGYEIQEGDILVPASANSNLKNAITSKKYLWEGGRIPYEFGKNFSCFEKEQILDAMKVLEAETCIKFFENENREAFIRFQKEKNGCYAPIGRLTEIGGPLPVNLQSPECFKERGIIEHELLHVVGLFHEQSRPDRDEYVTIHWCNIQPHRETDFLKGNFNEMTTFDLPYDYGSIMHYPRWAFSRNGKPTITSKVKFPKRVMELQKWNLPKRENVLEFKLEANSFVVLQSSFFPSYQSDFGPFTPIVTSGPQSFLIKVSFDPSSTARISVGVNLHLVSRNHFKNKINT